MNWDMFLVALASYVIGNLIAKSGAHKRELRYTQELAEKEKSIMLLNTEIIVKDSERIIDERVRIEVAKATHE